jgi:pSer/pThr/pTyr-binding forkhead associated (FHA) protein
MLGILWVKDGNRRGCIYNIKDSSVVGRREGDLIIDDPKVSNPHAKFTVEDGQFIVWDFGSRNGTFVNGERIRAATLLKENDIIKIGDSTFILKILE